jgi:diaminopropionate ammonia-lyase
MEILHSMRPAPLEGLDDIPLPSADAQAPQSLLSRCPVAHVTPLATVAAIATHAAVQDVWIKDERARMGLGSFKALGAAYVIACHARDEDVSARTYVTASDGNHGLSVAAGAATFGASSVVFFAQTVPESFAERLEIQGARVIREGATCEDSLIAAKSAAERNGWTLLSDVSWQGYTRIPHLLMEGYTVLMAEAVTQLPDMPTHIFLQAEVGGLASATAVVARHAWGDGPRIIVVEPDAAAALYGSIRGGRPVQSASEVSSMGRLDCKTPSLIALKGLARDADAFALISEAEGQAGAGLAMVAGFPSTPSGAAGIAALISLSAQQRDDLGITAQSRVLCILSEGPD